MEQKAPRLSSASLVVGGLCFAFAILNSTANLILSPGLSIEELTTVGVGLALFCVSFLASRERPIPELLNQPSIQDQFDAFESTPTPFRTSSAPAQQAQPQVEVHTDVSALLALEPQVAPLEVSTTATPNVEAVASALESLSSGSLGEVSARIATSNPAPHVLTEQGREFTQAVGSLAGTQGRTPIVDVPLPTISEPDASESEQVQYSDLPTMPDLDDLLNLPVEPVSLPALDLPDLPDVAPPKPQPVPEVPALPELPNLDGLF